MAVRAVYRSIRGEPRSAESTAAEVIAGIDLIGGRAIVTCGASGIGVETVWALAEAGPAVTVAVRNTAAGAAVVERLRAGTRNDAIAVVPLDLADEASVRRFVSSWTGPLDILLNRGCNGRAARAAYIVRREEGKRSRIDAATKSRAGGGRQ